MTKKWMAINLLLLMITGLLGWRLHVSMEKFRSENDLEKIQPVQDMKQRIIRQKSLPVPASAGDYIPAEFAVIPDKNVFSDTRSRDEQTDEVAQPPTRPLMQKPVLIGIILAHNQERALIIDPTDSSQGRGRRAQTMRVGDVCQGYTITSIESDHIVLESGARKEIIPLHEGSKSAQKGKTPILSTRVVSFGGGASSGGKPIAVSSGSAAAAPAPPPGSSRNINVSRSTVAHVDAPSSQSSSRAGAAPPASTQTQTTAPASVNQQRAAPSSGRTRIIRTPFGDIVRPVRD
jgi:hypothetical protein